MSGVDRISTTDLEALLARATPGPWRENKTGEIEAENGDILAEIALVVSDDEANANGVVFAASHALAEEVLELRWLRAAAGSGR